MANKPLYTIGENEIDLYDINQTNNTYINNFKGSPSTLTPYGYSGTSYLYDSSYLEKTNWGLSFDHNFLYKEQPLPFFDLRQEPVVFVENGTQLIFNNQLLLANNANNQYQVGMGEISSIVYDKTDQELQFTIGDTTYVKKAYPHIFLSIQAAGGNGGSKKSGTDYYSSYTNKYYGGGGGSGGFVMLGIDLERLSSMIIQYGTEYVYARLTNDIGRNKMELYIYTGTNGTNATCSATGSTTISGDPGLGGSGGSILYFAATDGEITEPTYGVSIQPGAYMYAGLPGIDGGKGAWQHNVYVGGGTTTTTHEGTKPLNPVYNFTPQGKQLAITRVGTIQNYDGGGGSSATNHSQVSGKQGYGYGGNGANDSMDKQNGGPSCTWLHYKKIQT